MRAGLVTSQGHAIRLGRKLGEGGEGAVYEVSGAPDAVAKLYHRPPTSERAAKLMAMAAGCTERLRLVAAWPRLTIHDPRAGAVAGFVMDRLVGHRDIHFLYGPGTRKRDYPDKTYRFLVAVAANVARAFAVVHEHGAVIGDVNHGGVLVSAVGTIKLVDCDSFQISVGGRAFTCDVGLPEYQPPELQSVGSFRGLHRRVEHDAFGLAVLLFRTLFFCRHPFAGRFLGAGELPIPRAIREYRFAFASDAPRRQMAAPPGSLGLGAVPPELGALFERAFSAGAARPPALAWVTAIDAFARDLRDCPNNASHAYWARLPSCPVCDVEAQAGALMFLPPCRRATSWSRATLEQLWRDLVAAVNATVVPPSATLAALIPPVAFKRGNATRLAALAAQSNASLAAAREAVAACATLVEAQPRRLAAFSRRRAATWLIASLACAGCAVTALAVSTWAWLGMAVVLVATRPFAPRRPDCDQELRDFNEEQHHALQLADDLEQADRWLSAARVDLQATERAQARATAIVAELERIRGGSETGGLRTRFEEARRIAEALFASDGRRTAKLQDFDKERLARQLSHFLSGFEVRACGLKGLGGELCERLSSFGVETADNVAEEALAKVPGFGPKRRAKLLAWRRTLEARFRPVTHHPREALDRAALESSIAAEHARMAQELERVATETTASAAALAAKIERLVRELRSLARCGVFPATSVAEQSA